MCHDLHINVSAINTYKQECHGVSFHLSRKHIHCTWLAHFIQLPASEATCNCTHSTYRYPPQRHLQDVQTIGSVVCRLVYNFVFNLVGAGVNNENPNRISVGSCLAIYTRAHVINQYNGCESGDCDADDEFDAAIAGQADNMAVSALEAAKREIFIDNGFSGK